MKNRKKIITIVLICSMVISNISMSACEVNAAETSNSEKEEVVYIMLNNEGDTECINVVNIFGKGSIIDFGDYSAVKMLTSTAPITQNGDQVTFTSNSDKIYYQGTMKNTQIPWKFVIEYKLNGKKISSEKLSGASGKLEIHMKITQNTSCKEKFFDSYALQAALTLDTNNCKNIAADGATLANVGADKQISYTVLPGKGLDAKITTDVTDFEMDAIAINGIKLDLNIEIDDKKLMKKVKEIMDASSKLNDGSKSLTEGTVKLKDGSDKLKDGATALYNGANSLNNGITSLSNGILSMEKALKTLNSKSSSLTDGSDKIKDALKTIQSSLKNVSITTTQLKTLTDSSSKIKKGIDNLYNGALELQSNLSYEKYKALMKKNGLDIDTLTDGNKEAINNLSSQIDDLKSTIKQIKSIPGYEENEQYIKQIAALESQVKSLSSVVTLLKGNNAAIGGTETYLNSVSSGVDFLVSGLRELKNSYKTFDAAILSLTEKLSGLAVNMSSLKTGIDTLVTNYETLDSGIEEYTKGVATIVANYSKLAEGMDKICSGSKGLLDGSGTLKSGTSELYDGINSLGNGVETMSDGTSEFYNKTWDMDTQVQKQIDEMIASISGNQSKTVSFVSDKNTDIKSVQFVIKTASIEKPVAEVKKEQSNESKNFWQKLLNLFGL